MKFMIISIIIISLIGTISHFIYDITNHNKIIGLFVSVNESTWEHIKIALTPTLLWSLVDGLIYGSYPNYFFAKFISLLSIIILIPILFYGYKKIFNNNNFIYDILIFYLSIIVSQLLFYIIINANPVSYFFNYISVIGLIIIFGSYLLLTLLPLDNFIFKDPLTNKYGYDAHK